VVRARRDRRQEFVPAISRRAFLWRMSKCSDNVELDGSTLL
jgi:hypothetical protein